MMAESEYRPGRSAGITAVTNPHQKLGAAYAVSLPLFEGPLDLLLHLIEQEKLDISEISVVAVTDQYLRTIEQLEEVAPGAMADFLVIASRLLYIKSTRLLPKPPVETEEKEDSSDDLIRQLLEYQQFKRVASVLRSREDEGNRVFVRPPAVIDLGELTQRQPEFGELDVTLLKNALRRALARVPEETPLPPVKPYTVTVAERIESIRTLLTAVRERDERQREVSFSQLLEEGSSRIEIIVTFLAVLELVKQREVVARQDGTFGEIVLVVLDEPEPIEAKQSDDATEDDLAATAEPEERSAKDTGTGETEQADSQ